MHAEIEVVVRTGRKRPLYVPATEHRVELGRPTIEKLIPHRAPFLFVDRITAVDPGGAAIAGQHRLDPADPLFRGHFPDDPIFPGVLQLEAIGQLGLCMYAIPRSVTGPPTAVRAIKIHHAAFLAPIRPGAELSIVATSLTVDDFTGVCAGQVLVSGEICCIAIMEVYFVEA